MNIYFTRPFNREFFSKKDLFWAQKSDENIETETYAGVKAKVLRLALQNFNDIMKQAQDSKLQEKKFKSGIIYFHPVHKVWMADLEVKSEGNMKILAYKVGFETGKVDPNFKRKQTCCLDYDIKLGWCKEGNQRSDKNRQNAKTFVLVSKSIF
ncbi:MAG: hypothetical protein EZS28_038235 [Streblomastix strix]|uniref:Uncharacterized protein n=1 Tax=Streblomastix strix TaxID=222440 RepID=A0A5J4U7D2_9EUKA|nr:MAG: hypothetical protein EZS28_038235 [Streblomastix strix]